MKRCCAIALAIAASFAGVANAQTLTSFLSVSGGDDLREGNRAFATISFLDGRSTPERVFSSGIPGNSTAERLVAFTGLTSAAGIRSITIRHDGNPRSGHPFDTYDNWDLRNIKINKTDLLGNVSSTIYNSLSDSKRKAQFARFDGNNRQVTVFISPVATEPDFVITNMRSSRTGTVVTIKNVGGSPGSITHVECFGSGRGSQVREIIRLAAGQSMPVNLRALFDLRGQTECLVNGVDASGRAEAVTSNNVRMQVL